MYRKVWENALRHLVPFVQFEKREKHPWRSVIVSKVAGISNMYRKKTPSLKLNLQHTTRFCLSKIQAHLKRISRLDSQV